MNLSGKLFSATAIAAMLATACVSHAATITSIAGADGQIQNDPYTSTGSTVTYNKHGNGFFTIGASQAGYQTFLVFQLPTLSAGATFSNASFTGWQNEEDSTDSNFAYSATALNYNVDLYGIAASASSTPAPSSFFTGANVDPSALATKIEDNFIPVGAAFDTQNAFSTTTAQFTTDTLGSAALTAFLNAQYAGGANAGKYIELRLTPDTAPLTGTFTDRGFVTSSSGATAGTAVPQISYTEVAAPLVPEPASLSLISGAVVLMLTRRRKNRV